MSMPVIVNISFKEFHLHNDEISYIMENEFLIKMIFHIYLNVVQEICPLHIWGLGDISLEHIKLKNKFKIKNSILEGGTMKKPVFTLISYIQSHFKLKLQILFLLSGFIPVLLLLLVIYPQLYKTLQKKELTYMENKIQEINNTLDQIVSNIEDNMVSIFTNQYITNTISNDYDLVDSYNRIAAVESILKSISSTDGFSYTLIDSSNQIYTNGSPINLLESFNGPLCTSIKESSPKNVYFTIRHAHTTDRQKTITLARPWYINGKVQAVLIVDILPSLLEDILSIHDASQYLIVIANSNYEIIYTTARKKLDTDSLQLRNLFTTASNAIKLDGVTYEKTSHTAFLANCNTSILIPQSLIFKDSLRLHWQMLFILILIIIQTTVFAGFISKAMSKEIILLKNNLLHFLSSKNNTVVKTPKKDEIKEIENGILYMEEELKKMLQQIRENERKKRHLEFKILQHQMNPHMIYNTLNTIIHLAQLQGIHNIEEVALAISHMLKLVSKIQGDFFTIQQELEFIQNYITLKKYNTFQNYELTLDVDEKVLQKPILKLLLQPFVENSIKYAFTEITATAQIFISIQEKGGYIHVKIKDNGCGISPDTVDSLLQNTPFSASTSDFSSTGIKNCAQRLALQYGTYHSFHLDSDAKTYTQIEISYPTEVFTNVDNFTC